MARKSEMARQIVALREENEDLRYRTTNNPREAIWYWLSKQPYSTGPMLIEDIGWSVRAVIRDGRFSREEVIESVFGSEENDG